MNPTDPQPPPQVGTAPHSVDLVVIDLAARKAHGIAKYGVAHQHDNGRDHLVDLYQELLEGAVYVRAEIERRCSIRAEAASKVRAWCKDRLEADSLAALSLERVARDIEEGS